MPSVEDGTAAGLLLFLDRQMLDRSIDMSTGRAYRTAVRRILGSSGTALERIDVRSLDVDEAWRHFRTSEAALTVGPASLPSYRARLHKSVVRYRNWLDHDGDPKAARVAGDRLIDYPFPVRDGVQASLRLPARLSDSEAARLAAFVQALALRSDATDGDG